jgi:hypothetical protein
LLGPIGIHCIARSKDSDSGQLTPDSFHLGGHGVAHIPVQGVHHITMVGSNREATIDFYQGVLGMPLIFEQPNLDVPDENHLYFDPGDGRLLTFFVRPSPGSKYR